MPPHWHSDKTCMYGTDCELDQAKPTPLKFVCPPGMPTEPDLRTVWVRVRRFHTNYWVEFVKRAPNMWAPTNLPHSQPDTDRTYTWLELLTTYRELHQLPEYEVN